MRTILLGLLAIGAAMAQDQTGGIEGVVLDAASQQPVKKATVTIFFTDIARGRSQNQGPRAAITDARGAFAFTSLPAGRYQTTVTHQDYPQARASTVPRSVQVAAGQTVSGLTVELVPGAVINGHVVDEDGDPLSGCSIQAHQANNFNQTIAMTRGPMDREDGSYRLYKIAPGKYVITAECSAVVFQPRPLSEGPDPPPKTAYPMQFYPAASDLKSAEIVELLPGAEKSGVDFRMRSVPVTHIRGILAAGNADWRGRTDLQIQLLPLDPHAYRAFGAGTVGPIDSGGSFEIRRVFPGSYWLVAFSRIVFPPGDSQPDATDRIGAMMRVDVTEKPVEATLRLHHAMELSGSIQIEQANNTTHPITPSQIRLQLTAEHPYGGPPSPVQISDDGTFHIKSVLPGEWRLSLLGQSAFLKSALLGSEEVAGTILDLTSGSAVPLRIVVSTNMASVDGTAPAGRTVFSSRIEEGGLSQIRGVAKADANGQFAIKNLAPGKYRIVAIDNGATMPDEGGQEISLHEGETALIEINP